MLRGTGSDLGGKKTPKVVQIQGVDNSDSAEKRKSVAED